MKEGINGGSVLAKPRVHRMISKSKEEEEAFLKSLPSGYRFKPLDFELVDFYLRRKVYNQPLPQNRIREVQLYNYDPDTLTEISNNKSSNGVVNEWYFFTPRDRKYRNGTRPERGAGDGFWKATGADKLVKCKGNLLGFKKTLVFCRGKQPHGVKTNWIMHEYVLSNPPPRERASNDDMRLDDWVLCRVYKKQKDAKPKPQTPQQGTDKKQEGAEVAIPAYTETKKQEYGILPLSDQQFQVEDFNMLPQQTYPMPFYHNIYHNSSSGGLPKLPESFDTMLEPDSTIFSQQAAVSEYGNFIPTAVDMSPIPSDQFHSMGQDNFNIQQQQQQFSDFANNFEFTADDKFLLDEDFGLPDIYRDL
ncbi:protein ATAF2-like [Durio zibethinus]|uniref:Protein ATAF2-like n=1 Tax=Durio zibethinus TaxID=66656 RepID=A0A6P5Z5Y1_DURZI|nr:protein ATAF2-like [Durio zibethinus]